jgi:hypothetical protein
MLPCAHIAHASGVSTPGAQAASETTEKETLVRDIWLSKGGYRTAHYSALITIKVSSKSTNYLMLCARHVAFWHHCFKTICHKYGSEQQWQVCLRGSDTIFRRHICHQANNFLVGVVI